MEFNYHLMRFRRKLIIIAERKNKNGRNGGNTQFKTHFTFGYENKYDHYFRLEHVFCGISIRVIIIHSPQMNNFHPNNSLVIKCGKIRGF